MFLLLKIWICACGATVAAGWIFSAFGFLTKWSYLVLSLIFLVTTGITCASSFRDLWRARIKLAAFRRRFKRPLPFFFGVIVILSFLGGALYQPVYADALGYRLPRLFHWLAQGQWHWIHTGDPRMNVIAPDTEWLWAPVLLLARNEKWCFLISFISYIFLPGVSFAYYRRIGVSSRLAWYWMWLLPTGWCYAFQAGSLASDGYCATFALASVTLALRARERNSGSDLLCSMIAIALVTGVKQTNLLLVLLWAIPLIGSIRRVAVPKLILSAGIVTAILISFIPISVLNEKYTGNWKGFPKGTTAQFDLGKLEPDSIAWGILGNSIAIPAQNLLPPYFPWVAQWNSAMERLTASSMGSHLRSFERFGYLSRAPAEHNSGLGCGLCILSAISIAAAIRYRVGARPGGGWQSFTLVVVPWMLLLIFMAKISVFQNARYLAPYYPFLLAAMLRQRGQSRVIRMAWWRWGTRLVAVLTILMILVSRQRPLWPGHSLADLIELRLGKPEFAQRVRNAFAFYEESPQTTRWLQRVLPPDAKMIGYAAVVGYSEVPIWKLKSVTQVRRFLPEDSLEDLEDRGIHYLVVEPSFLKEKRGKQLIATIFEKGGKIISKSTVQFSPESTPEDLWLIRLP
jgi:hypothetical protein